MRKVLIPLVAAAGLLTAVVLGGIGGDQSTSGGFDGPNPTPAVDLSAIPTGEPQDFGPPPDYPDGPWSTDVAEALGTTVAALSVGVNPAGELATLAATGDARIAWALADLLRFIQTGEVSASIQSAIVELTGIELDPIRPWGNAVEHLMAWDTPAPPEYFTFKRDFYSQVDPRWGELFHEVNTIDWRLVGWGGVAIDDRPAGSTMPCSCIPALDDPPVTGAEEGGWYPDDRIVFGVVVGDEARAYPKNIMEVHEMVNDTVGGRRIGMPYCTLCGSAQAYYTDELGSEYEQPVFRTSGLLIRSNKMMYDLTTKSFVDTFTGRANAGPLAEAGITFEQVSVVTATWGEWKQAHPDTTIVAEDGGLGRTYELDPLGGRDDNGPIFPIGAVDTRLPVQEHVLGIRTLQGEPVAVHVATAKRLLEGGDRIVVEDVEILLDGDGIRAVRADGTDAAGHQAFWFAWSQFWPRTQLWPHDYQDEA